MNVGACRGFTKESSDRRVELGIGVGLSRRREEEPRAVGFAFKTAEHRAAPVPEPKPRLRSAQLQRTSARGQRFDILRRGRGGTGRPAEESGEKD
jgi:hypothetical protein